MSEEITEGSEHMTLGREVAIKLGHNAEDHRLAEDHSLAVTNKSHFPPHVPNLGLLPASDTRI
eukprot:2171870-Rhodomonas_salina.1